MHIYEFSGLGQQFESYVRQYPDAILLASGRKELALLYYYSGPKALASWNPSGKVDHHFDIHSSFDPDNRGNNTAAYRDDSLFSRLNPKAGRIPTLYCKV